jgi:hypothetical protein
MVDLRARLPIARHALATVLLAGAAVSYYGFALSHGAGLLRDPAATLLYPIGVAGLALGIFWARYFVICFCASLAAIRLAGADWYGAWSQPWLWLQVGGPLLLAGLLVGPSMRRRFEGRGAWLNRWGELLESRLDLQLRLLIVAQSVALGLVYGWRGLAPTTAGAVVGLGALALLGLLLLRTAALLPLAAAFVAEGVFLADLLAQPQVTSHDATVMPLVLGAALLGSVIASAPLLRKAARLLRVS